ncbi:MAG: hypothetical protein WC412_02305 [Candidatus Omnitrophota bacterium]|jgi:hypothetical protein
MLKNIAKILGALAVIILLIWAIIIIDTNYNRRSLQFPYPSNLVKANTINKYFCKTIVGTRIEAIAKNNFTIKKGVHAEVFKARDKFFVEIEADKLYLARKSFFKSNDSKKGNLFAIIYNDEHKLLAIDSGYMLGPGATLFAFNKDTGIATLTKVSTNDVFTNNPGTQSYCLKCDAR